MPHPLERLCAARAHPKLRSRLRHVILCNSMEEKTTVTVQVKLFATLRRHHPHLGIGEAIEVKLPNGATVGRLIEQLQIPAAEVKVIFVNSIVRNMDHPLADGDEVGVFPAVGGG